MAWQNRSQELLSGHFGNSEHADRGGSVIFRVRPPKLPVKDIVRTEVYNRCVSFLRSKSKFTNCRRVHGKTAFRMALTFVHRMVDRTVNDNVRKVLGQFLSQS
jgi:hypothetical protein